MYIVCSSSQREPIHRLQVILPTIRYILAIAGQNRLNKRRCGGRCHCPHRARRRSAWTRQPRRHRLRCFGDHRRPPPPCPSGARHRNGRPRSHGPYADGTGTRPHVRGELSEQVAASVATDTTDACERGERGPRNAGVDAPDELDASARLLIDHLRVHAVQSGKLEDSQIRGHTMRCD